MVSQDRDEVIKKVSVIIEMKVVLKLIGIICK